MMFLTNIWGLLNASTLSFRSLFSSLEGKKNSLIFMTKILKSVEEYIM